MSSQSYEKRSMVLKLLYPRYASYCEDEKSALHHSLMWTMEALKEVGLMEFVRQSDETS